MRLLCDDALLDKFICLYLDEWAVKLIRIEINA